LGKDSLFNNIIFESIYLGNLEGNYNFELEQYSDYVWRVRYENYFETGPWSFIGHFYTGDLTTSVDNNLLPTENELYQNYPNPFNPNTTISYTLLQSGLVKLKVYDILGNEMAVLVNEEQSTGNHKIEFNGTNFPSGVYFYRLINGAFTDTKKLILLK
jgi:hypothetical protein